MKRFMVFTSHSNVYLRQGKMTFVTVKSENRCQMICAPLLKVIVIHCFYVQSFIQQILSIFYVQAQCP